MAKTGKRRDTTPRNVRFTDADWALIGRAAAALQDTLRLPVSAADFVRLAATERAEKQLGGGTPAPATVARSA